MIDGTAHRSRSIARATLPSPPSLPFAALACITFVYRVLSASYPKLIVDSLVVGGSGAMRSMGASIALHHTRSLPPSPRRLPPLPSPQSLPSLALPMPFALDSLLQLIVTYKGEGGGELERHNLSGFFIARAPPPSLSSRPPRRSCPSIRKTSTFRYVVVSRGCARSRGRRGSALICLGRWVKKNFYVGPVQRFFGVLARPLWLVSSRQRVGRVGREGCVVGWAGRRLTC